MRSKLLGFLFILATIYAVSCASTSQTTGPAQETSQPQAAEPSRPAAETFDPRTVTQAQYDATREEVQRFIEELNRVISNRNYNAWRAALSNEYFAEISSAENLKQISEQPAMRTRRITLRTAQDYFLHVVVPSRADSRVDDIRFIGTNRVQAFTVNTNARTGETQSLRLYDLEKIGNSWKIIN